MIELPPPERVRVADDYETAWDDETPHDTRYRGFTGTIQTSNVFDNSLVKFDNDEPPAWIPDRYLITI